MVGPVLEEIAEENQDVKIVKVNVDENQQYAGKLGVFNIPTMIMYKNGEPVDKLVGATAGAERSLADGFVLSTARCSYEIVEKAVKAGATTLVTVSLPTSMAVERAKVAGLSLWALARDDSVLAVVEPEW